MDKTVVVTVEVYRRHPLYGRLIRSTRKFKAHDATNRCHVGDQVQIRESRPLSKDKRWVVAQVLQVGQEEIPVADVPEAQKATS
jgi:small subunit ribosomal protein S17